VNAIAFEIRCGRKIGAIKQVRHQTGWGLKEAKQYIDKYTEGYHGDDSYSCNLYADRFIEAHMPKDFLDGEDFKI
jgi:hypothetical protein